MVLETEIIPFWQWLISGTEGQLGALPWFLSVAAAFAMLALVAGYLLAAVRHGPLRAGDLTYRVVRTGVRELFVLSPRRVTALAWLAVKESFRRQVLIGLLVFLLILVFAGWFLGRQGPDPAKLYLSFVLTSTTYLVLLLALFLSAFSLPTDIRNRTIYTIVTKPVRAGEVVLGRILGIAAVGTVMLVVMGACSYLFVVRSLDHTHTVDLATLTEPASSLEEGSRRGVTSRSVGHRHDVEIDASGNGQALPNRGHRHAIHARAETDLQRYAVGPPDGLFRARIPIYGKLRFKDRAGMDVPRGISVGNEWTYRSYIEGGSMAAAIWTFDNIEPRTSPDGLPIDLMVSVFRT
ncbi:MAG: ABC transporter permease, partial [Pirellulales bacterium]